MSVALLVISDGRAEYLRRTLMSIGKMLPAFDHVIHVDDAEHRLGFSGAVQEGWRRVLETDAEYLWHAEQDFTYNRPVPLAAMVEALAAHQHLAQIALLRQPWNEHERAAGGIVQMHPDDYAPVTWNGHRWLEHRRHVTTNPAVWPRWVIERGWPQRSESEGHFGIDLFASDPSLRAAYWGAGEEWCEHIGDVRSGTGY